jgi:hypothetical protein
MTPEIIPNKSSLPTDHAAAGQKNIKTILKELESDGIIGISVDCVIFGFDDNELKVLLIKSDFENMRINGAYSGTSSTTTKTSTRQPTASSANVQAWTTYTSNR